MQEKNMIYAYMTDNIQCINKLNQERQENWRGKYSPRKRKFRR